MDASGAHDRGDLHQRMTIGLLDCEGSRTPFDARSWPDRRPIVARSWPNPGAIVAHLIRNQDHDFPTLMADVSFSRVVKSQRRW